MSGFLPPHIAARRQLGSLLALSVLAGSASLAITTAAASPSMALPSSAATLAAVAHPAAALTELNESRMNRAISRTIERASIATAQVETSEKGQERTAQARAHLADAARAERARKKAAATRAKKAAAARKAAAGVAAAQADPQGVARRVMGEYGFGADQFGCLQQLWTGESNWNYAAQNAASGAYGIPQALPGSKMAVAGADWRTNPETQIRWGLGYIKAAYGTPCGALGFWNSHYPHWY